MRCVWYISSDVLYTKAYLGLGVTLRHDHVRVRRYKLILGHNPFISDGFWDDSYTRCTLSRGYLTWVWSFCIFALWGHISLICDWFWRCFFYSKLPHFDMMYSYWGIATSLIFDVETWPLVYECCFRWIIEMMIFWDQSPQLTWFDVDIHVLMFHTCTFYLWHHYTYIHLILLELYWYFTLSLPFFIML